MTSRVPKLSTKAERDAWYAESHKLVPAKCCLCGVDVLIQRHSLQRMEAQGKRPTCGAECPERKAAKHRYDVERNKALREEKRAQRREYYYAHHAEILAKMAHRKTPEFKAKMRAYQKEHNARPAWKEHKFQYDRVHRSTRDYGPEWGPVAVALWELRDAIDAALPDRTERYRRNGTLNKSQERKRNATSKAQRSRAQGSSLARDE